MDNCLLIDMPNLSGLPVLYRLTLPNNRLSKLEGSSNLDALAVFNNLFTEIPVMNPGLLYIDMSFNPLKEMSMPLLIPI